MDDLEKAILVGADPQRSNEEKAAAATYLGNLAGSPTGWRLCLDKVFSSANYTVQFNCLSLLMHVAKHGLAQLSADDKTALKTELLRWMLQYAPENASRLDYPLKGKFAQLVAYVFLQEYPSNWPQFFSTMQAALASSPVVVELFLRVLDAIDEVVVSHEFHRTPADIAAANTIKDQMRTECVGQFAEVWYNSLATCQQSHPILVQLALKNIKQYIVWIDINLIVTERFLQAFYSLLTSQVTDFREGACECLESIAAKGMKFQHKIDLLVMLRAHELIAGIRSDDVDFQEKLAKLLNQLGLESIDCRSEAHREKAAAPIIQKAEQLVESSIELAINFMGHDYDDISCQVFPFVGQYLYKLRHADPLSQKQLHYLQQFLAVIAKKIKFTPAYYNFENPGDDEAAFQEYRADLEKLYLKIYRLQTEATQRLLFENLRTMLAADCTQLPMPEVEGLLFLFHALRAADHSNNEFYKAVMVLILQSNVSRHQHFEVPLILYEILVRYAQCLPRDPGSIAELLKAFLDERGVRHRLPRVRGRVSYQFKRIVKEFAGDLQQFECHILASLMPILDLNVDQSAQFLVDSDLEHLYEAAGILAYGLRENPANHKQAVEMVSNLPLSIVERILVNEEYKKDTPENPRYCRLLIRALSVTARFSKGFKQCTAEVTAVLKRALDLNMMALQKMNQSDEVRKNVMIFLHGMIECVGKDIFAYLPVALTQLLESITALDMQAFLRLLMQLINRFKGDIEGLINGGLTSIVERIFFFYGQLTEDESERKILQRHYYLFINTIANNKIAGVFLSEENRPILQQILDSLFKGCAGETTSLKNVKTSLVVVELLCRQWLGVVPGFEQFILTNLDKICFQFPLSGHYRANDADCYVSLLSTAKIFGVLKVKFPAELAEVASRHLLAIGCTPEVVQTRFLVALDLKSKALGSFLMAFFEEQRKRLGITSNAVS